MHFFCQKIHAYLEIKKKVILGFFLNLLVQNWAHTLKIGLTLVVVCVHNIGPVFVSSLWLWALPSLIQYLLTKKLLEDLSKNILFRVFLAIDQKKRVIFGLIWIVCLLNLA